MGSSAGHANVTRNQGNPFATALIAHLPALRRYATALSGNASAADDLVQDCIERALKRSTTLQDPERMAGWLRSILHNLYLDQVRHRKGLGTGLDITEMDNDPTLSVPPGDHGANIDFVRAFEKLSLEHRQILLLVGLEGLNYREVAAELNIPIGTVMSRLARARERLRGALEHESNVAPFVPLASGRRVEQ
jgi:RNA polymerase sigma-70 factor (ECF subfamily)